MGKYVAHMKMHNSLKLDRPTEIKEEVTQHCHIKHKRLAIWLFSLVKVRTNGNPITELIFIPFRSTGGTNLVARTVITQIKVPYSKERWLVNAWCVKSHRDNINNTRNVK